MSRLALLKKLRTSIPIVAPSMLKCDFGNLQREVELLEQARTGLLHLDVMDGHFVPNLSYGPMVIERLRALTQIPFDAHLMISEPQRYLNDFLNAGCNCVTVHIETEPKPEPLLQEIQSAGAVSGLSLNPGTPVEAIEPYLTHCDLVLVMSVEPGFGGQTFLPSALDKLRRLRQLAPPETLLSVDGGIGPQTIAGAAEAGADVCVAGSAILGSSDYAQAIAELTSLASDARCSKTSFVSSLQES